jgi:murein L,D-transpeptidase YafK
MQNRLTTALLSFLVFSSLHATMLNEYRMHGIDPIVKQMDKDLRDIEYWQEYLKNIDTRFGYIESYQIILTCDKSKSQLALYAKDSKERYKLKENINAFTGKMHGDKVTEGDLKTPVGIYKLTKKLSNVDSFYGPLAFVTSYPNTYDLYRKKSGSGIWIHGLPIDQERDSFTKGCIAIDNQSIESLDKNIDIEKTLLLIQENKSEAPVKKEKLANLLSELFSWRYAWIYSDISSYLEFYDRDFQRYDGLNFNAFSRYKRRIFKKQEAKTIRFNDINIIPYPGEEDLYEITFFETYKSNSFSFSGNKILIVKLQENKIKIITEK